MFNFILKELGKSGYVKIVGNNAMILCPFHEDRNPSLGVSLRPNKVPCGTWNCFGCGRSGSWNSLASKLGLKTIGTGTYEDPDILLNKKIEIYSLIPEEDLTLSNLSISFKWKRYTSAFLKKFGAKLLWHDIYSDYYLYLPFYYLGDYYGFVRCKIYSKSIGPKYWFNCQNKILYPIENMITDTSIVLVEGVADALRLIKNGIPALAILGSFLTNIQLEMLEVLAPKKIILCMDGDKAGREAVLGNTRSGMASILSRKGFDIRVLFPPEGEDPDSMPYFYLKVLKKMRKED